MHTEIICKGNVLPIYPHKGESFSEAPKKGTYKIRLRNDSPSRRLAVVSVDGANVLSGEDAGAEGAGYVLRPWETLEIPGWRRGAETVAEFEFRPSSESYVAKTGRGTKNVGVIGVAVFDEKVRPASVKVIREVHHHYNWPWETWPWPRPHRETPYTQWETIWGTNSNTLDDGHSTVCSNAATNGATLNRAMKSATTSKVSESIGTGYGSETTFYTVSTHFERATAAPTLVIALRYASREQLKKWGVPLERPAVDERPNPFPASPGLSVPAPVGWRG